MIVLAALGRSSCTEGLCPSRSGHLYRQVCRTVRVRQRFDAT